MIVFPKRNHQQISHLVTNYQLSTVLPAICVTDRRLS
nr:MAG TPA: hypothetical protein [Caudoviricetes sp.]